MQHTNPVDLEKNAWDSEWGGNERTQSKGSENKHNLQHPHPKNYSLRWQFLIMWLILQIMQGLTQRTYKAHGCVFTSVGLAPICIQCTHPKSLKPCICIVYQVLSFSLSLGNWGRTMNIQRQHFGAKFVILVKDRQMHRLCLPCLWPLWGPCNTSASLKMFEDGSLLSINVQEATLFVVLPNAYGGNCRSKLCMPSLGI